MSVSLRSKLSAQMGISGCFDQLHVHAHGVTALLHAAFQNVGNAKLLGDLPQILRRALIVLGRSARDDLQIGDLRSEEHTSELQSLTNLVCRLLLEKKKTQ